MSAKKDEPGPPPDDVVTHGYEGPDRRRKMSWLKPKARLDDARPEGAGHGDSIETMIRRVSLWGDVANADRVQRARFLALLEALADRGRRENEGIWVEVVGAAANYLRAVGANGRVDDVLMNEALLAAGRAHSEQGAARRETDLLARLAAAAREPH